MKKNSRLSRRQQELTVEWMHLVTTVARYFVQNRPSWQRGLYIEDLEGEGFLALAKAARTYDPARLPYPKAYFARAILNAMLKHIKRATRAPGERLTLDEAEQMAPEFDELDHLRMAIESLDPADQLLAMDRFVDGATLQTVAGQHDLPLRTASLRSRRLAKQLAELLGIQLPQRRGAS